MASPDRAVGPGVRGLSSELVAEYRLLMAEVYELAGSSRRISEREAAAHGTTVARWHVLSAVSEESATVPEIARRLGQVRQGVQRVVDELVAEGHLVAGENPRRRRSPLFSPTPVGREVLERLWAGSEPRRLEVLDGSGVDTAALRQARETLRRLLGSLVDDAATGSD